ncbi:MAG: hypothetical protein LKH93_11120 [Clostridium beijerinckii]|jgi:hypothetical protein|nr:hypothetical protein [Clostridium beijerinckii]MCI1578933.1 hypothetical protein [Clostridium beijerinckii]MCI1582238.1 hypothetical protein [Clostridium beijerinckii]MCI1622755.1 hypothetical protein [Clostridium beijerinckii]
MNDKIKVILCYDDEKEDKELLLNQLELTALLSSEKIGSEHKYYNIKTKIFEDYDEGYLLYIKLETAKII